MAQLHCYVPDEVAARFQEKAKHAHLPVSKYLAKLIKKEVEQEWPEDYFSLFGSWEGDKLQRPDQGELEQREELK
ncbi:MAG: hypothetical protein K9K37_05715 [Desulfocapsa sp.]|nr:hypothetical protein [Desulfocapsa sp.]